MVIYIYIFIFTYIYIYPLYIYIYIYIYTEHNTGISFWRQFSREHHFVMQTLQLEIFFGEGGMGAVSLSLLILLYIIIWLYILIYTIFLHILFFKTIIFFPKFNFLASYSSLFLKSNLTTFPYLRLKPKVGTQNRIPPSILVFGNQMLLYIYNIFICL